MTISKRIESIDILRGIVMIIMCLDHTRDYFQDMDAAGSPMNLATTTPSLFFTRYITHFCAPIFVFLSGVSVYLQSKRKSKKELTIFLLSRGLWLVFLEIFLNNFLWSFDISYNLIVFQVIWAIGASMIVLAGLIHFNKKLLLLIGLAIVVGHNLLDVYGYSSIDRQQANGAMEFLWYLVHQTGGMEIGENHRYMVVGYPMLAWLGVMILGYCTGSLYSKSFDQARRAKYLITIGSAALLLFILLRFFNFYGDPQYLYEEQESFFKTLVTFLRISKYPPSLHYVLVTLGVCFIALGFLERFKNRVTDFLLVFGRVPLFFYFVHIAVIHLASMLLKPLYGDTMYSSIKNYENHMNGADVYLGTSLLEVYIAWVIITAALYYPSLKYMRYKMANKDKKWLSYF